MTELEYMICESERCGEIDLDTRDTMLNIITEKKTKEQYRMDKFKKTHNFKPDKPGSKTGTILVDGKRQRVDLDTKSGIFKHVDGQYYQRVLGANLHDKDSTIYLTDDFFKTKNPKRSEAMLQHEIGHTKMHSTNPHSIAIDKKKLNPQIIKTQVNTQWLTMKKLYKQYGFSNSDIEAMKDETVKSLYEQIPKSDKIDYMKIFKKVAKKNPEYVKGRNDIYNKAKKYDNGNNPHVNANEIEADRYAANRTSEKDLKRGLRETYKKTLSTKGVQKQIKSSIQAMNMNETGKRNIKGQSTKMPKKYVSDQRKESNKLASEDYRMRVKALKDKDLRNSKYYK